LPHTSTLFTKLIDQLDVFSSSDDTRLQALNPVSPANRLIRKNNKKKEEYDRKIKKEYVFYSNS